MPINSSPSRSGRLRPTCLRPSLPRKSPATVSARSAARPKPGPQARQGRAWPARQRMSPGARQMATSPLSPSHPLSGGLWVRRRRRAGASGERRHGPIDRLPGYQDMLEANPAAWASQHGCAVTMSGLAGQHGGWIGSSREAVYGQDGRGDGRWRARASHFMLTVSCGLQKERVAIEAEEDRPARHRWQPTGRAGRHGRTRRRNRQRRPQRPEHAELDLPVEVGAETGHRLKTRIGHHIGWRAPISMGMNAWAHQQSISMGSTQITSNGA